MPPVSFADIEPQNLELTPMRVLFQGPSDAALNDLGGTLDNVVISMGYKKSDMKVDQLGSTVVDRRVSGIDIKVTTSLAEVQNKDLFKVAFPHATKIPVLLTGVAVTADTPAVVTKTAHGLKAGDRIKFTVGTLPTGLSLNVYYWVIAAGLTANDFQLSLTKGGAAIDTTGTDQTGITLEIYGKGAIDWNSAIGDGDQNNAGKLVLHPLSKPTADVSTDWTFFRACSTAESEISYGPEGQAKFKVVWTILPDLSVTPARFFRYGDTALV